ncbi:M15 family metallopeptidase [Moraxella pluranimalium]|uniref:Peptidase M15C domain-containing protein n=1 Tax=Moraxella pluranimalium TaxID=470453 RepID=A0A1T0CEY3_9GAMM|nr:M15 family metallopeptidase [Moraxella pluranimalium]OOS20910.1 hypothetical protein B0680_10170 [Moraxella pluranimalium]
MKVTQSLILTLLFMSCTAMAAPTNLGNCLNAAYEEVTSVTGGTIYFKNGSSMALGKISSQPFTTRLKNASVADQLSQTYPLNFVTPAQYADAGRIRNDEFFKQMYGKTAAQVQQNLTTITWKPSNIKLKFNHKNGAAKQLEKVGNEIAQNPALKKYVAKSLGTFNWRNIAGTNRLSVHSFGVAVDFQLPQGQHKYWRWDGCTTEDKVCPYPKQLISDDNLKQVVRIFEKHGFIWGGKWASYDSPHFEYRPELLISSCRA